MRLPDNVRPATLNRGLMTLALAAGLSACGVSGRGGENSALASVGSAPAASISNNPRADYPVVVGEPYRVGAIEYVPIDTLNYDHVGYLALDDGALGYSGAHHTLPIPSYVEVTSLETGRTVLVRLERRGPMTSNHLLALSPAAFAQLGASAETPVRVRRVNPPEDHRFLLRAGDAAPLRMDTPVSLLTVLQRRIPESGAASLNGGDHATVPEHSAIETIALTASDAAPAPPLDFETAPELEPAIEPLQQLPAVAAVAVNVPEAAVAPAQPAEGNFMVQAATFSTMERAERAAAALGGQVLPGGRYFRVRTGPFATRGEAEASLANVHRAGYSDARILTSG